MSAWKGDFLGFTYGSVHSSSLGIVRISEGSRFSENLLPTQQNRVVTIPGRDETYFFGSNDTQKQFNISYAFDHMTEEQLGLLRSHFAKKNIQDLEFDEKKGIIWKAKVTSSSIKYIPFSFQEQTIYKGEGSLQLTCYYPYGIEQKHAWFEEEHDGTRKNFKAQIDNLSPISTDWNLTIIGSLWRVGLWGQYATGKGLTLDYDKISKFQNAQTGIKDEGLNIDSSTGLIRGVYKDQDGIYQKSNNIYNEFITAGTIFKIDSDTMPQFFITSSDQNFESSSQEKGAISEKILIYKKHHY